LMMFEGRFFFRATMSGCVYRERDRRREGA
jgi:hypothetical protein